MSPVNPAAYRSDGDPGEPSLIDCSASVPSPCTSVTPATAVSPTEVTVIAPAEYSPSVVVTCTVRAPVGTLLPRKNALHRPGSPDASCASPPDTAVIAVPP